MKRKKPSVDSVNSRTSTSSILGVSRDELSPEITPPERARVGQKIEKRRSLIGLLRVSNVGALIIR